MLDIWNNGEVYCVNKWGKFFICSCYGGVGIFNKMGIIGFMYLNAYVCDVWLCKFLNIYKVGRIVKWIIRY